MKQTTQYHLGALLLSLTNLAQHLMGASGENENPNPVLPAEPTTDKPKVGRPRKPADTGSAVASSNLDPKLGTVAVEPSITAPDQQAPVDDFADEKLKPPFTWDQLKKIGWPVVKKGDGANFTAMVNKLLPADRQGQGLKALADFPDKHAEYVKNVEGLLL